MANGSFRAANPDERQPLGGQRQALAGKPRNAGFSLCLQTFAVDRAMVAGDAMPRSAPD